MAAEHRARATWEGDLMGGAGRFALGDGSDEQRLTWRARVGEEAGTSPEELLAGALASCFSMALSNILAKAGTPPARLDTNGVASFDRTDDGYRVTRIALDVRGDVPGADEEAFRSAADEAKSACPVSQALKGNVEISLDAALA